MRRISRGLDCLSVVALLSVIAPVRSEEKTSDVIMLTGWNFDEHLKLHRRMLVEFYAPWCHYCQEFEPKYEEVATAVKNSRMSTAVAKVDGSHFKDLGQRYDATSFPTLVYFEKGLKKEVYDGERDTTAIVDWLFGKEYPLMKEIREDEIAEFCDEAAEGEFSLVARVKQKSPRHKAYKAAAEKHLGTYVGIRCAVVMLPDSADAKADATLSITRMGFTMQEGQRLEYHGPWTGKEIAVWARNATYPLIGSSFSDSKYGVAALESLSLDASVVALLDEEKIQLRPSVLDILRPLAHSYPKWRFTIGDVGKMGEEDLKVLGAKQGADPQITVLRGQHKYILEGAEQMRDSKNVTKFLADVKANKARPRWKSAPPPAKLIDSDGVTELTGATFEDYVLDPKKDVLVMFYAPWCGYCKEEAVEWAKAGRDVQKAGWRERGVIVAKMDGTENDSLENVTTYPRLWFYPAVKSPLKSKTELAPDTPHEELMDFLLDNARNLDDEDALVEKKTKKKKGIVEREMEEKKKKSKKKSSEL